MLFLLVYGSKVHNYEAFDVCTGPSLAEIVKITNTRNIKLHCIAEIRV